MPAASRNQHKPWRLSSQCLYRSLDLAPEASLCCAGCFPRKQRLHFTASLRGGLIGMEFCGGSHILGRALRA